MPHWMDVKVIPNLKKKLIGLGFGKLFMPTPGFGEGNHVPKGTPSTETPPFQKRKSSIVKGGDQVADLIAEQPEEDIRVKRGKVERTNEEKPEEPPVRRSNKIWMKSKFNFKNTPDSPVNLRDD